MKTNKKVKTFQVSEKTHGDIVKYCLENSLKINPFVDKLLSNAIRSLNESKSNPE